MNRKGLSLMELSVALVVIGLLTGLLIMGSSLISTSRIAAGITQIQQFDSAVKAFKQKHKYLPGDAPIYGGDGDNIVDATSTIADNTVDTFGCEIANFWSSLDPGKYVRSSCVAGGSRAYTDGASKNVPLSKWGVPGSFYAVSAKANFDGLNHESSEKHHYYFLLHPSQAQISNLGAPARYRFTASAGANYPMSPADLAAIDRKMDDARPNYGYVQSATMQSNAQSGAALLLGSYSASCNSFTTYVASTNTPFCVPAIRVGAQELDPQ